MSMAFAPGREALFVARRHTLARSDQVIILTDGGLLLGVWLNIKHVGNNDSIDGLSTILNSGDVISSVTSSVTLEPPRHPM
jgi:hypothetical protein